MHNPNEMSLPEPASGSSPLPPLGERSSIASFLKQDAVAAGLLFTASLLAFLLANSSAADSYNSLWTAHAGISFGAFRLDQSFKHWINDGLMAVFFFLVGLEIKREVLVGELASVRKALLPAVAALGGMACPALIYILLNWNSVGGRGWGIPMATDIAFASGCIGILGKRIPPILAIFLVALAIADDLGSVAVIALFYTSRIEAFPLTIGASLIAVSYVMNRFGVRRTLPYAVIGAVIWVAFLESGVHATIAGVLLAFTIPANARYETPNFFGRMKTLNEQFADAEDYANPMLVNARQQTLIRSMLRECHHVEAPLQRLEHLLHPFCVVFVLPVFAFANAGVTIQLASFGAMLLEPVTLGVFLGLILGKQFGIMSACWIAVKTGWAELPEGMTWRRLYGLSWLAAIGFTMSLFIADLAFASVSEGQSLLVEAKVGIFLASLTAGLVGYCILWFDSRERVPENN